MLDTCDFRCVLKVENVWDRRRSAGRLFQTCGLATARALLPMVERRTAGTRTSAVDAERSRQWLDQLGQLYKVTAQSFNSVRFSTPGLTINTLWAS